MDVYTDYQYLLQENEEILSVIKKSDSTCYMYINDCIKILDYIYIKYDKKEKLEQEEENLFYNGLYFLDMNLKNITYYYNLLNKDIILFNKYDLLIFIICLCSDILNDLGGKFTKEQKDFFEQFLAKADECIETKSSATITLKDEFDEKLSMYVDFDKYTPFYMLFSSLVNELEL